MFELLGLRRRGGFFGGGRGNRSVGPGDYLVTLSVEGVTQKQVLHVEQYSGFSEPAIGFGAKASRDQIKR